MTTSGILEIDQVLAGHHGFMAKELDFILNYDSHLCLAYGTANQILPRQQRRK